MRVLVTGATGYIGGRLVPRLVDAGHDVRVLVRHPERLRDVPAPGAATLREISSADLNEALGPLAAIDAERIVLVDGAYSADLSKVSSDAAAIELMSLAAMLEKAPTWLEGKFSATPIAAGGKVYFQNEAGVTYVIEPGPDMKLVSRNHLDAPATEIFRASLTPSGGQIFARSDRALYCIGSPATGGK